MAQNICIIGAGSWGTALALTAQRAGQSVTLIPRRPEQVAILAQICENSQYLPGFPLPADINISADITLVGQADIVLQVTPAQTLRDTCMRVRPYLPPSIPFVICAKGIMGAKDGQDARLLSSVTEELLPNPAVILSGPSFAQEVAQNLPTAVTIASAHEDMAKFVASSLRHSHFRCYVSDDPVGVQVAGAVKNVLAIACGIVHGKAFGNNAAAALITRGLAEMRRLGVALGGKEHTFLGLAGVGDVTLTCSGEQSRNMRLGKIIGSKNSGLKNPDVGDILNSIGFIAEGVPTVKAVHELSQKLSISMPVCEAVYNLLYKNVPLAQIIENMLARQSESEF